MKDNVTSSKVCFFIQLQNLFLTWFINKSEMQSQAFQEAGERRKPRGVYNMLDTHPIFSLAKEFEFTNTK